MQNEFISVASCRPTLGKIESTPQIGYALVKVCENATLNHKRKYYVTKTMHKEAGAQAVGYTMGYFESLTTGIVWRTPQTTSKVVYLSASAPTPSGCWSRSLFFCTCADDLILRFREFLGKFSRGTTMCLLHKLWPKLSAKKKKKKKDKPKPL